MAQSGSSISGTAVASATVGGLLIYAALRDVSPVQALREVATGKPTGVINAGNTVTAASVVNEATVAGGHPEIVTAARKYLGIMYKWGGASPTTGFDCSGLVTWVLVHDIGLTNLPSSVHTTTGPFLVWRGALTVSGTPVAGDLICWAGHIAIASGNGMMIEAPGLGKPVREVKIRTAGATIRRVIIAQTGNPPTRGKGQAF